jgi:hypothetical protein
MPNSTASPIPRRVFLGNLLLATSAGCGREGLTEDASVGQKQPKVTGDPADAWARAGVPLLENCGMRSAVLSEIRRLITQPRGMLLCCGPPASGFASTLYACLRDDTIRRILRNDPSLTAIKAEAVKNGMVHLQADGLRQVILGRTSIAELLRVLR